MSRGSPRAGGCSGRDRGGQSRRRVGRTIEGCRLRAGRNRDRRARRAVQGAGAVRPGGPRAGVCWRDGDATRARWSGAHTARRPCRRGAPMSRCTGPSRPTRSALASRVAPSCASIASRAKGLRRGVRAAGACSSGPAARQGPRCVCLLRVTAWCCGVGSTSSRASTSGGDGDTSSRACMRRSSSRSPRLTRCSIGLPTHHGPWCSAAGRRSSRSTVHSSPASFSAIPVLFPTSPSSSSEPPGSLICSPSPAATWRSCSRSWPRCSDDGGFAVDSCSASRCWSCSGR